MKICISRYLAIDIHVINRDRINYWKIQREFLTLFWHTFINLQYSTMFLFDFLSIYISLNGNQQVLTSGHGGGSLMFFFNIYFIIFLVKTLISLLSIISYRRQISFAIILLWKINIEQGTFKILIFSGWNTYCLM